MITRSPRGMLIIRLGLTLLCLTAAVIATAGERISKKVLLISSGNHTLTTRFMVPFMKLLQESPYDCEFTSLELLSRNGSLLLSKENQSRFENILEQIKDGEFDAVIIAGDPAYQSFSPYLGEIPPRTPVIFAGRVLFERVIPDGSNATGHSLRLAPVATAELALRLFPERKDLILVTDGGDGGRRVEEQMRTFIRNGSGLTLTVLRGEEVNTEAAIEAIRVLQRHGVVIYHRWLDRKSGRSDVDHEFINQIGIRCSIPIFKLTDPDILQHGVVGGVAAGVLQASGADTARRMVQIFGGTAAGEIPSTVLPVQTVIHSEMLDFFAVAESLLPENTLLLGRKESLWLDYQQEIVTGGIIVFSLLLSAVIFGLMFVVSRRSAYRNAEVVRTLPVRYFVVDGHGNILHYAAGDDGGLSGRSLRTVADLPNSDAGKLMAEKVAEVLKTGKNLSVEFESDGRLRSAVVSKLPTHLFHRETAVWISQDITELSDARKAAAVNRSLLENLLAHLPVGIAARQTVGDGKFVLCNEAFGKIVGRPAGEIENRTEAELNFAGFNPEVRRRQDKLALESGRTLQFMEELFAIDGSHQVFQVTKFPLRLRDGEMLMVDTFTDITELEDAKRQTENANKLWNTVINAVPFFFYAKDADNDFRYIMANRKLAEFYNLGIDQLLGKNDRELKSDPFFPEEDIQSDEAIMLLPNGKESTVELLDGCNRRRHVRIHKMPFTTIDGRQMLLGVGIDVSLLHNLLESERISNEVLSYATLETDFEKTLEQIARTLRRQLNCDRMMIGCRDHEGRLRLYRAWRQGGPSPVEGPELEAHQALWNRHLDEFEADQLVTVTAEEEPDIDSKSLIMAPVRINQQLWGMLFVGYTGHRRAFSDVDERIMRSTANIIALSLIRKLQLDEIERSNREKQLILNNIGIPIWLYDATGRMIRVNTAACAIIGMSESEILKEPYRRVFCSDSPLDDRDCPIRAALASGRHEQTTRRFNGREYIINAEPILDDGGKAINVVKSAIDVTDLNELMANEQLLNSCMAAVLAADNPELAIKLVLEAFCRQLGADRCFIIECNPENGRVSLFGEYQADDELPRIEIASFRFKPDEPWMLRLLDREPLVVVDPLSEEGRQMCGSWVAVAKQYGIRSIYSSGIFVNGKLWGKFGVIYQRNQRNFSERELKFLQAAGHLIELAIERNLGRRQLLEALRQAQTADKAKSFFLASMSHEIRTPLNAVIGFAELLQDNTLEPALQNEYLAAIASAGNALLALINDVLDLSKLEAGQMEIHPAETDFAELVYEIGNIFRRKQTEKGLESSYDIRPMPLIYVDKLRLRQILFNLMGNALKFTEAGKLSFAARFEPEDEALGTLTFKVMDTGIGIPAEDQQLLFEPFVQSKTMRGTHTGNSGTGLGLAIVKRMLDKMGGTIELESEVGKGSTFTVTLRHVAYCASPAKLPDGSSGFDENMSKLSDLQVLIVDDVQLNLMVLGAMLGKLGITPHVASGGAEALKVLQEHRIDLVLSDLWMPELNGAELADRIRRGPGGDRVFLAAVTADVESSDSFDMASFDTILTKPVTLEKLRRLCEEIHAAHCFAAKHS